MSLREELTNLLYKNKVYDTGLTSIILELFEKRIDEYQQYCEKMANKENDNLRLTFMLHQGCCMRIKEMLK